MPEQVCLRIGQIRVARVTAPVDDMQVEGEWRPHAIALLSNTVSWSDATCAVERRLAVGAAFFAQWRGSGFRSPDRRSEMQLVTSVAGWGREGQ
jgi:hypothetical protein